MVADVSAFVLAGGKSTRMGSDKALIVLDGRPLLSRALEIMRSVNSEVRIVGDPQNYGTFAACVPDIYPNCGPLGGIHAALRTSPSDLNLVLAVDLPFVSPALLQFLTARALQSPASIVTVPSSGSGLQPLCAVYRRDFLTPAENALRIGRYKIDALFDPAITQVIGEDMLNTAGFSPDLFRNLNTPDDLAHANKKRSL